MFIDMQARIGAQPFVKWVGGKRSLLPAISPLLPSEFRDYFEPFAGGAALFFALSPHPHQATLLDRNRELILAYQAIKKTPGALLHRLNQHAAHHSKDYYYRVRRQKPTAPIEMAARFLYLNKTCFNGLYRVNKSGGFNSPMGSYQRPNIVNAENIRACHVALQSARVLVGDFEQIEKLVGAKDFVYLDPPYHPTTEASFTKYTKENFTEKDQVRLRDFIVRLSRKGAFVMMSNSKTRLIADLYDSPQFHHHTVTAPRTVNCKPLERDRVEELLITNYPTHARERGRSAGRHTQAASAPQTRSSSELHREFTRGVRL